MARRTRTKAEKTVETLRHKEDTRKNLPTAEFASVMREDEQSPIQLAYERRNRDLDPQLVWRGKDEQDWSDLVVQAPPLYIQEKVHPKVLIDDLQRRTEAGNKADEPQIDMFADFNGLSDEARSTEFYQHDASWTNRMILGDSLQVMASLAEREGLRGKVQCIYVDPPYGIKFNSNFQWSTTSRNVTDGKPDHITREPEQVKAFRDTWRDGIHSYLTYLRDRLSVARDLLSDTGSIFVQIGDENVHRIRAVVDEVFGEGNFVAEFLIKKTGSQKSKTINSVNDYILFYAQDLGQNKFRRIYEERQIDSSTVNDFPYAELPTLESVNLKSHTDVDGSKVDYRLYPRRISQDFSGARLYSSWSIMSTGERPRQMDPVEFRGEKVYPAPGQCWSHTSSPVDSGLNGMQRLLAASRLVRLQAGVRFKRYLEDFRFKEISNWWDGFGGASNQIYVVQTNERVIERCLLMATDPGDLVLDPTCGSGTTAYVAERWGRRWITIDTSRVALALARARIMGARYPYHLLADSRAGQLKEAEVTRTAPSEAPTYGNIRQGFVYRRAPHIMSSVIANNAEIDVIWEQFQGTLEPLRQQLNQALEESWEEWEIPRDAADNWPKEAKKLHAEWWEQRIARQKEIDASIAAKADPEYLYDKPYDDRTQVRVAGPFTVESLLPHRVLGVDEDDELIDGIAESKDGYGEKWDFPQVVLENLKTSGVQQAHKEDKITFTSITPWPGDLVCAEGRYIEGDEETGAEKRAAIFVGPEFGTVSRPDLVAAAREAGDGDFDALITCAFNYDAHSSEFDRLGRIPVLKARINADLHMAGDLKNTGKGNLFVIFGEPDIDILDAEDGQVQVKINGVDVFHPSTGEVRSDGADGIACWFIDTDYNEESFFVRHAYFLGANDPYKSLKTTLKAEINEEAWATLHSDTSRPFGRPTSGRIAVKVINHLGDEVMKVFRVGDAAT
jgi:adenine-specific DNA-methyltransferase